VRILGRLRGAECAPGCQPAPGRGDHIGISEQTLESDLQGGQTVAQVATANHTTAQAVINALVGDETTAIDNLVSSGKITAAQGTKLQANVTAMVTNFVNQTARPPSRLRRIR